MTISLAGYAFARLSFPGRDALFYVFLLQLMLVPPILIVPNLRTIVDLGLYGSLLGVMAPYFASAFGTFLMRQTFRQIPRDFEEAATIDGAQWWPIVWHVLLPMAKPGLIAFSLVSLMAHWNEFLWPLMVLNDPSTHTLTIGLASFTRSAEGGREWGLLAAGTLLVMSPLLALRRLPAALRRQLRFRVSRDNEENNEYARWRPSLAAAVAGSPRHSPAAQTKIDFFFPVPVDGKLAREMARLIKVYNDSQKEVAVTAVYTGSYDDTKLKAQAAANAGKPPAVVLMSANFVLDLKLAGDIISLEPMLKADGTTRDKFLDDFWPAVHANAIVDGELYAMPFQNSTPLLYYNVDTSRKPASIPRSRRRPGPSWSMPPRS